MNWYKMMTDRKNYDRINNLVTSRTSFKKGKDIGVPIVKLPSLFTVPKSEKENLFIAKLQQCSKIFDFIDPRENIQERNLKAEVLMELDNFITDPGIEFSLEVYREIIEMVSNNIFRIIYIKRDYNPELEMIESVSEASWPHLQLVYAFFLKFLKSNYININLMAHVMNESFVSKLIDTFNSEDCRERGQLQQILHQIYLRFIHLREFIRNKINEVFLTVIHESEYFNGIAELLRVVVSIIKGLSIPLKKEHKEFAERTLFPLVKTKYFSNYYAYWTNCVFELMDKDSSLKEKVVITLLKYWPKTSIPKELIFLDITEELMKYMNYRDSPKVQERLFRQIANCIVSYHCHIALRALNLCRTQYIAELIERNPQTFMAILIPYLNKASKDHWNETVVAMALELLHIFGTIDAKLFRQLTKP
ncbi:serine/threonine-protein phosphatase 2A 56 kDa regulatory subunit epsilon isoform-like [Centruroides vittatus]|uniref:serine/threonine-protein phosphatase 2A 56 kDa regulatory subunit epsilon isoform-like n=1 Tax=Centruroides vittatus TaxID=120091 RepID=UPI0035104305